MPASKQPLRVCLVVSAHPVGNVRVTHRFMRSLLDAGHSVTWLGTSRLSVPGKLDLSDEVKYVFISTNRFGLLARLYILLGALFRGLFLSRFDLYISPDPDAAFVALLLARVKRAKCVFDIHEYFHSVDMLSTHFPSPLIELSSHLVKFGLTFLCRQMDLVLVVTSSVGESIVGLPLPPNFIVLPNYASMTIALATKLDGACFTIPEKLRMIVGFVSPSRASSELFEAIRILHLNRSDFTVVMVADTSGAGVMGYDRQEITRMAETYGITKVVEIIDRLPVGKLLEFYTTCHVQVVSYNRSRFMRNGVVLGASPVRLSEGLASGMAILAPEYDPVVHSIFTQDDIGYLTDFDSPEAIAKSIGKMLDDKAHTIRQGNNARALFLTGYNWESAMAPVLTWLETIK